MTHENEEYIRMNGLKDPRKSYTSERQPMCLDINTTVPILSFETHVPDGIFRCPGLRLIIEYAMDMENEKHTSFDVWLSDYPDTVREYQFSERVFISYNSDDIQKKILEHLNNSLKFYSSVVYFLEKRHPEPREVEEGTQKAVLNKERSNKLRKPKTIASYNENSGG